MSSVNSTKLSKVARIYPKSYKLYIDETVWVTSDSLTNRHIDISPRFCDLHSLLIKQFGMHYSASFVKLPKGGLNCKIIIKERTSNSLFINIPNSYPKKFQRVT